VHFFVCLHCLHWVMQWRLKARLFTSMCCHVMIFLAFQSCWISFFFSVKPDILLLNTTFSLSAFFLSKNLPWVLADEDIVLLLKFGSFLYNPTKVMFTLTLRNIQRGVSHMRGRYILWHWLVLYICMFVSPFLLRLLSAVGAWIVHNWQLLFSSLGMLFGMNVFRLWNHREGMCVFKSLHFDFSLFSLSGGFTLFCQGFYSYKVLGRKYTNVVFWLL